MIRRNIITGRPIVFAPDRAGRPNAFVNGSANEARSHRPVARDEECPFCPGNEAQTPPEIERVADGAGWRVRVFPNKYPAFPEHEIIVDAARHDASFETLEHPGDVIAAYLRRYRAIQARPGVRYTALFKNCGRTAGASIAHLHAQVAGVPFLPPRPAEEAEAFRSATVCPLCRAIESHRSDDLLTAENESFVAIAPHGSSFAYQQWIVPKRHQNGFATFTGEESKDLAVLLQRVSAATARVAQAHNWLFLSFPDETRAHCYLDVVPRVTSVAGFELATGSWIEVVDPAATVRLMSTE